jgi:hypothetical protein
MKEDYLQVRVTAQEKEDLATLVEKLNDPEMSVSRFVRDAVREKMTRVRRRVERTAVTEVAGA